MMGSTSSLFFFVFTLRWTARTDTGVYGARNLQSLARPITFDGAYDPNNGKASFYIEGVPRYLS